MTGAEPSRGFAPHPAALVVVNPAGNRSRVPIHPLPFLIGRHPDNHLVVRDNRVSRTHGRIVLEREGYVLEDLDSTHGLYVNGRRIRRQLLRNADRIEFGIADSYHLVFTHEEGELSRLIEHLEIPGRPATGNLGKLRALMEVARALQTSLSVDDVLAAVVNAALAVTGSERGFLLLREGDDLQVRVARDRHGSPLPPTDLRVPTRLINRALQQRRELLSMNFDPASAEDQADRSVLNLELRSVVCVPLIRLPTMTGDETMTIAANNQTAGLLYMDSRIGAADLSSGNRELLQTLALEASTILENARLLEQERQRQRLEEELDIAREIQMSLLPKDLPQDGWFRAVARSIPSHAVGGDYVDVRRVNDDCWAVIMADVSGKGVSAALLAALLQGAFLLGTEGPLQADDMMQRINLFLHERTGGEKYATAFFGLLNRDGVLRWTNAGHCAPIILRPNRLESLDPTGMPLGLLPQAEFTVKETRLGSGEKLVVFTDGITEAQNVKGEFFEVRRVRKLLERTAQADCSRLVEAILSGVEEFTGGTPQSDDMTCLVCEFAG
jgi:Serine phosphatase RsbU, regulator of sigma subunit